MLVCFVFIFFLVPSKFQNASLMQNIKINNINCQAIVFCSFVNWPYMGKNRQNLFFAKYLSINFFQKNEKCFLIWLLKLQLFSHLTDFAALLVSEIPALNIKNSPFTYLYSDGTQTMIFYITVQICVDFLNLRLDLVCRWMLTIVHSI